MTKAAAGRGFNAKAKQLVRVDSDTAEDLINAGYAKPATDASAKAFIVAEKEAKAKDDAFRATAKAATEKRAASEAAAAEKRKPKKKQTASKKGAKQTTSL